MLRKAAEGGYDKIGWVTGEQTADRYDLSRRIDGVQYDNGIQMLTAIKDDAVVLARRVKPNEIADYIGKEPAERLLKTAPVNGQHQLKNADLRIGATWATNLYDRAIPNFLSKYGKKWGVKVGESAIGSTSSGKHFDIEGGTHGPFFVSHDNVPVEGLPNFRTETAAQKWIDAHSKDTTTVHSLTVTPEMRASVLSEGQPLFSRAPDPIPPSTAKAVEFQVRPAKEGLPAYLRLESRSRRSHQSCPRRPRQWRQHRSENGAGVGHSPQSGSRETQRSGCLESLESRQRRTGEWEPGCRAGSCQGPDPNPADELAILHEELYHAAVQRKPGQGNLDKGVPYEEMAKDAGIAKMRPRIEGEIPGHPPSDVVVVAEAAADLAVGTYHELTP